MDSLEIRDALSRYCRAVDRRDPEALRSLFHPDAVIDKGAGPMPRDEYIEDVMRRHADVPVASHQITSVIVDHLEDDSAFVESYGLALECRHASSGDVIDHTFRVRYGDVMERRDGAWRILTRRVVIDQVSQAPAVELGSSMTGRFVGTRDADDPIQQLRDKEHHRDRPRL